MGMSDINRENQKQRKMTDLDRARSEFETLEYHLTHNPQGYGEDLELAQKRYEELRNYFALEKLEKLDKIIAMLEEEQEKYANTKADYDLDLGYYNAYEKALGMLKELVS